MGDQQHNVLDPLAAYLDGLRPQTRLVIEDRLRSVARDLGVDMHDFAWHELNVPQLVNIRDASLARGLAPSTVNMALSAIRGVARAARDLGLLSYARWAELGQVRNASLDVDTQGRALSSRELQALFAVCARDRSMLGVRDLALLAAIYAGGMRAGEVVRLQPDDWVSDPPSLRVQVAREYACRTVLLGPRAADAVLGWAAIRGAAPGSLFLPTNRSGRFTGERINEHGVRAILRTRVNDAGLDHVTATDIRYTAIRDLWRAGASQLTIMRVVGSASPWTLERFCEDRSQRVFNGRRAKPRGQTAYHRWEPAGHEPDILALLRRANWRR